MFLIELPEELLLLICRVSDIPSLINLSETCSGLNRICFEVISQKKDEYLMDKRICQILDDLRTWSIKVFRFKNPTNPTGYAQLAIFKLKVKFDIELRTSSFAGWDHLKSMWPFSKEPKLRESLIDYIYLAKQEIEDVEIIKEGLEKVFELGYIEQFK